MADLLCPVCARRFEEGAERCPQCGRPRPGVIPEYMKVPWERAATYIGSISAVLFVLLLLLAPRPATEPSSAANPSAPEAERSASSEGGAPKEASPANNSRRDLTASWNCTINTSIDSLIIRGEVKNATGSSIKGLQLVGTLRTADGTFISSDDGYASYDTILPGQTSPFEIHMNFNPAARSADLSLKNQDGEMVEFSGPHSETCTQSRADL